MTNAWIILLTVSVLTTLFFAFLWWTEKKENGALRNLLPKMKVVQQPPPSGLLSVANERLNELENENAGLRVDVATGCKTINAQITAINELRRLLHASQARNRAPVQLKKA